MVSNVILLVFLLSLLIYATGTYYHYSFVHAQGEVDNQKKSTSVLSTTNDSSSATDLRGEKGNGDVAIMGSRDVLYLENFDHPVKIINDTGATINDPSLTIETIFKGIKFPTSMAFLGPDDILVLEKNQGTVKRIVNGNMLNEPLLDVNVANNKERGMLGIAISKQETKVGDEPNLYVFLYYTETKSKDGEDLEDGIMLGNRLYRYELVDNKLINPRLLLDLPVESSKRKGEHQGGVVLVGPDKNVYLVIGDVNQYQQTQNILDGKGPNGTSGILRITQEGKPVGNGILGDTYPLNLYYAYGIRNSFGMDFDPITGNLWDTENGLNCCDEINLVEPGFNSGWAKVQGIWELNQTDRLKEIGIFNEISEEEKLVDFDGKGKYSSPEFIWYYPVGPSAIKFLNSDKLGKEYENDIFVGNVNHGNLYHFDLSENRRELLLRGNLINKSLESHEVPEEIVFATGLGRITDIDVGPDGNMYILSHTWNKDNQYLRNGSIFKISKSLEKRDNTTMGQEIWTNYDELTLSVSTEKDTPISGSGSLRVDIIPASTVEETVNASWRVISSDFIPVRQNAVYNYSLDVSAIDVNQLHSKVFYYDANKTDIKWDFIFRGTDGTFKKQFSNSFLSPQKTEFIKIQIWTIQSVGMPASYLIDNVKLVEK